MIRQVTAADVERFSERILAESTALFNETGKLAPMRIAPGLLLKMLDEGDRMWIGEVDGSEGERIAIIAHREPGEGIYITHMWGPSGRFKGILRYAAQRLVDAGHGSLFGHFPAFETPVIQQALAVVGAVRGDYRGGAWVPSATGSVYRVRISTALTRIRNANWPVEA